MARFSTGLRNAVAGEFGIGVMMNGGVIRVYGSTRPATPDAPPGTAELGRVTTEGRVFIPVDDPNDAGLYLRLISPGALIADAEMGAWRLKGLASGAATWWRWNWRWEDPNTESDFYPRIDGTVGATGELRLTSNTITAATNREIEQFLFVLGMGV
jgi:hypothetical protein